MEVIFFISGNITMFFILAVLSGSDDYLANRIKRYCKRNNVDISQRTNDWVLRQLLSNRMGDSEDKNEIVKRLDKILHGMGLE